MSSMTPGSDDDAHKDELELDHSEKEPESISATNGNVEDGNEDTVLLNDDPIDDETELEGDDHPEDTSELGHSENSRPIPAAPRLSRELGTLDDGGSIPDDSPSVHVCRAPSAISLQILTQYRAPYCLHEAAYPTSAPPHPVSASGPIVRSTSDSKAVSPLPFPADNGPSHRP